MARRPNEPFSKQETERRFEAALRGAFKAGPVRMSDAASRRRKVQRRPRKAVKDASA